MKLFGIGDNKKDYEEIYTTNMENDMIKTKEDSEEKEENIEEDYIDLDDLDFYNYEDIIDTIENNGWSHLSSSSLTTFNTDIIHTKSIQKNILGTVLEIACTPGMMIAICGFNQEDIDKEQFNESPNLYMRPHFLALKLTDDNDNELSSTTIIGISKINRMGEIEKLYHELYGDLSPTIEGRLKRKKDRYYLADTIILQYGDKLLFHIYYPYTDITKIQLLMMADIFKKVDNNKDE